jgi:hypothetical protein
MLKLKVSPPFWAILLFPYKPWAQMIFLLDSEEKEVQLQNMLHTSQQLVRKGLDSEV